MQTIYTRNTWFVNKEDWRIVGHDTFWTDVNENKVKVLHQSNGVYVVYNGVAYYFMGIKH